MITNEMNAPIRNRSLSTSMGHFAVLASQGIFIGAPRSTALDARVSLSMVEIPIRIESLPTNAEITAIIEHTHSEIFWRVTIDDLHIKHLSAVDWMSFVSMLSQIDRGNSVIISFERSVEYSTAILDSFESFRVIISMLLDTEHASWKSNRIQGILKSLKISHAYVDGPSLPGIVKDISYYAGKIGFLRCVGRNGGKWFEHESNQRFAHTYNEAELAEIAKRIRKLRDVYDCVYVSFWNRPALSAIENAVTLSNYLLK